MRIDVFTIFPELLKPFLGTSLIGRALENGLIDVRIHDLRAHAPGVHRSTDDAPFGGGAGMVMSAEPIMAAIEAAEPQRPLYALGPAGDRFDQDIAHRLASSDGFSLLCGRYEGIDHRIVGGVCEGELSIGDYVLNGGEVAAAVVIEAVGRLVPGVMGNAQSAGEESFGDGLLEYPQYTRPAVWRGNGVPEVLLGGDHGRVDRWRQAQAVIRTARLRPDMISARGGISEAERRAVDEFFDLEAESDGPELRSVLDAHAVSNG